MLSQGFWACLAQANAETSGKGILQLLGTWTADEILSRLT